MKVSFPRNDNGTADTNKNGYYRFVGLTSEIQSGRSKSFMISDQRGRSIEIAVFNKDGQYYAISNICIHKGAPLSKGILKGDIVTCSWHGWKYSIKNGRSPHKGGDSVNSYEVKIVNSNKLFVNCIPFKSCQESFYPA